MATTSSPSFGGWTTGTSSGSPSSPPTNIPLPGGSQNYSFVSSILDEKFSGSGPADRVYFDGPRIDYVLAVYNGNLLVGDTVANRDGLDTLSGIEFLHFADGKISRNITNDDGSSLVYRLYQAAFGRTPDEDGFLYWAGKSKEGMTISEMAACFMDSREFRGLYGVENPNSVFVNNLYRNVLGRDGEPGGITYWNQKLDDGSFSRQDVLASFADAPENKELTFANVEFGYFFI